MEAPPAAASSAVEGYSYSDQVPPPPPPPRPPRPPPQRDDDYAPATTAEYLNKDYWDKRFKTEESYEWCKSYSAFRHLLLPHLRPDARLLVVGCGNSGLSEALYRDGYSRVTSVDISATVIEKMRRKAEAAGLAGMQWMEADMLELPFPDASFDVVIEKGTLDVLFVDDASAWEPKPEVQLRMFRALDGIHRVLSPAGVLLSITFAQPHFRSMFYCCGRYSWTMAASTFGDDFQYFVQVLSKGAAGASGPGGGGGAAAAATGVDAQQQQQQRCPLTEDSVAQLLAAGRAAMLQQLGYTYSSTAAGQLATDGGGGPLPGGERPEHDHMDREDYLLTVGL